MKTLSYTKLILLILFTGLFLVSCQKEPDNIFNETGTVELQFENIAGGQPLILGNSYTNSFGEDFKVTKFKYYVTNLELINTATGTRRDIANSYFLVNEENAASKSFTVNAVTGDYNAISFLIGVDSLRNVNGAQTGALDPALDMFWTWNSGYIMAKLEGSSSFSTLVNHMIEYHIGGFQGSDNVLKKVPLNFPSGDIKVLKDKNLVIKLRADVNAWFQSPNSLPIASFPTCTSPGNLARQYADNYSNMFSINSVLSE